jgi:prophage DNA circulation protein
MSGPLALGSAVVAEAVSIIGAWSDQVTALVQDATSLAHMIGSLTGGNYGRYFAGARTTSTVSQAPQTIQQLIGIGTAARAETAAAILALKTTVVALGVTTAADLAAAAQATVATVLAALPDPQDAVRLLQVLAGFTPTGPTGSDAVGVAIGIMRDALGDMLRRAAIAALARASAIYNPSSYNDAMTVMTSVVGVIDDEITVAGDKGDDRTYRALRSLRMSVVADLTTRGGDLAQLMTVTAAMPIPSLALAYRLYGDATREAEIVGDANPPHPAFMPVSFQALAR